MTCANQPQVDQCEDENLDSSISLSTNSNQPFILSAQHQAIQYPPPLAIIPTPNMSTQREHSQSPDHLVTPTSTDKVIDPQLELNEKNDQSGGGQGPVDDMAEDDCDIESDFEVELPAEDMELEVEAGAEGEDVSTPQASGTAPQSAQEKLKEVKFHKVKKAGSEELESSQSGRKMKVVSALSRYQRFKAIHEASLKAYEEFKESTKDEDNAVDFNGELEWMMTALSISDQSLKKRERRLNEAITEGQDEIEIIPFQHPMPAIAPSGVKAKSSVGSASSRAKSVKRYLDLEAGVSEKEVQEEGCGGKKKRRKTEYKSAEFVYDDGDSCEGSDKSDNESEEEEEILGPDAVQGATVDAKDLVKKGKGVAKDNSREAAPPLEELPISLTSVFHNAESILDVSKLIESPSPDEIKFLRSAATTLNSNQFDWGDALKESVIGVISCWKYHENSQLGQPTHETLQPLVVLMQRKVREKDTPKKIQTCPRLLQVAATNPYLTESSLRWPLIMESTRYPWDSRHRIFRAFHSMACRTSKSPIWTAEKDIKNKLRTAHKTIHRIFEESVELISYNAKSENIEIKTVGEHKVHASMVPMSQSIAWAWQQCMMKTVEEQEVKSSKVHPLGISWLQKRFLLVLTGVMLIYERDVYNRQLKVYCKVKRTPNQIAARRNVLKGSVLNQLSTDYIRKNPIKALPGVKKNQVPNSEALAKVTDKEIQTAASEETFSFRRQAIQALALFLMFGTSGLFHVWVWYKEQRMTDAALLIHMSSVLAQRRNQASKSEPHVFYQRSWSRLDHHLFSILREFIDDKGDFKRKIQWPSYRLPASRPQGRGARGAFW
ncbi:hypothetical protein DFH28DRAFT_1141215 [Melampsora americana]|nr:hypothetical protein DFH28DRAFT_1141215 [Melampsora americana]